jgi:putative colanic acid biosynthesis UDP-glucose lipid carrier transferase
MYRTFIRPVLDRVLAATFLLLFLPLLVATAVVCKLFIGSIIFRQTRIGLNGKPFVILKFRSMRGVDHGLGGTIKGIDVNRTPPVGAFMRRWRIDELPQLVNVLKGEMSLIGPRPLPAIELALASQRCPNVEERHLVLPGLAGLAQVRRLEGSEFLELIANRIESDLEFVANFGWKMDLRIILLSPIAFFCGYHARPKG